MENIIIKTHHEKLKVFSMPQALILGPLKDFKSIISFKMQIEA